MCALLLLQDENRAPSAKAPAAETARSYTGRYLAAVQAASSTVAAWLAGGNVDEVRAACFGWQQVGLAWRQLSWQ